MNNECFTIPEILFHPSDIGIKEMGISEAIVDSVESCFDGKKICWKIIFVSIFIKLIFSLCKIGEIKPHLYSNIILIGGNALFNGYRDRM